MMLSKIVIRIEGYPDFTLTNSTAEVEIPALRDMGIRGTVQLDMQYSETKMLGGNITNRKHPTCIDVTTTLERPYSSWICGIDCPTDETPQQCGAEKRGIDCPSDGSCGC